MEVIYAKFNEVNWHDPNTQFDAELGWSPIADRSIKHKWGDITTNSLGFRSKEINPSKNHVIVLGDSVAWGYGVGDKETLPYYLNQRLQPMNYQVHNLAVSGYGIDQYYLFLQRHIDQFKNLKYIIAMIHTGNDFKDTTRDVLWGKRKPLFVIYKDKLKLSNVPISRYDIRNIISGSKILNKLSRKYESIENYFNSLSDIKMLSRQEGEQVISLLLKRIHEITTFKNAKLIVVIAPRKSDLIKKSADYKWFKHYFDSIDINEDTFMVINYYDVLKNNIEDLDKIYRQNEGSHFSRYGNQLLANKLFDKINFNTAE